MCDDVVVLFVFFFKQKTAYEMRISDWSSDVCSSDLLVDLLHRRARAVGDADFALRGQDFGLRALLGGHRAHDRVEVDEHLVVGGAGGHLGLRLLDRSEEHTSELQSLMRISYAVFCLKKKIQTNILDLKTARQTIEHSS